MSKLFRKATLAVLIAALLTFGLLFFVQPAQAEAAVKISGSAHVQTYGWQAQASKEAEQVLSIGTTGQAKRLEAVKLSFSGIDGQIQYKTHVQTYGWQDWVSNGALSGTSGQAKRLEAIQIKLSGAVAEKYDVYYRVHAQTYGWLGWAKNGENAGTSGMSKRLECLEVVLMPKGQAPSGYGSADSYKQIQQSYSAHVQTYGTRTGSSDSLTNTITLGTTGQSKRVEAISVSLPAVQSAGNGGIRYRAHVQTYGWQDWKSNGASAGTSGQAKRLEAIQIELTGALANQYDVYYRVHAQTYGWLDWAKNGASAGTEGMSKRLESVQIVLVVKGGTAPGATAKPYIKSSSIMGATQTSVNQMVAYWNSVGKKYPADVYKTKGAADIRQFCQIIYDEARAEGVRAEVVFAQIMHETGWLQFGGSVKAEQCNFAGLGATNSTVGGATFDDVRTGIRAQVQHLKAYASTDTLKNTCVDPRFNYVKRGCAPYLEDLNGRWAVPGTTYGQSILSYIEKLLKF